MDKHAQLLDELPTGSYALPAAAGSATLQVVDNLFATVVFFLALLQQQELDRSAYYVPLIAAICIMIMTLQAAQEWLRVAASRETYHRIGLAIVISKLCMLGMSYLMGILSRSLANNMTNGPAHSSFNIEAMLPAFIVIVLFVIRIHHTVLILSHRLDITRWLPALAT